MDYLRQVIRQFYILTTFGAISWDDKLRFFVAYIKYLLVTIVYKPKIKTAKFLDGSDFSFFGSHKNMLLDHVITHVQHYWTHYRNAKIVIDVGSAFGDFALMVQYFNPKATIFALEMSAINSQYLKSNVGNKKNITVFNNAVGNKRRAMRYVDATDFPEGSRILNSKMKDNNGQVVEQITLDDFIATHKLKRVSLLKIDTEGHEVKVLQGLGKKITVCDTIIVETDFETENLLQVITIFNKSKFKLIGLADVNWDASKTPAVMASADLIFANNAPH